MRITLIAALDRNRAIGRGNAMPWHLPDDFRHFKQLTLGKPVIMGHRTAISIGRPLPDRLNIVMSRSQSPPFAGQLVARSLDEAISLAAGSREAQAARPTADVAATREERSGPPRTSDMDSNDLEVMIAGGGEIYSAFLPLATDLRLTLVDTEIEMPDTFFPAWGSGWAEVSRERHAADDRHAYAFDWIWLVR